MSYPTPPGEMIPPLHVEGRDPADRKPVAPMPVGHAQRVSPDPGEAGHVGDLLEDAAIHGGEDALRRVNARGHEHARLGRGGNLPHVIREPGDR